MDARGELDAKALAERICEQAASGWICELSEDAVTLFDRPGICDVPPPPDGGVNGGGDGDASTGTPDDGDAG